MVRRLLLVLSLSCCVSLSLQAQSAHRRWVAIGHDGPINDIQIAPNGKFYVTAGSWDGRVIVWDAQTNRYITHFQRSGALSYSAYWSTTPIAISPDSRLIAFADTEVHIWDTRLQRVVNTFPTDSEDVIKLRFSTGSDSLAWISGSRNRDAEFVITDLSNGTIAARPLKNFSVAIGMAAFPSSSDISPDLRLAVVDGQVVGFDSLYAPWSFTVGGRLYQSCVGFDRQGDSLISFEYGLKSVLLKTSCLTHEQRRDTIPSNFYPYVVTLDPWSDSLILFDEDSCCLAGYHGGVSKFRAHLPYHALGGSLIRFFPAHTEAITGTVDPGAWGGEAPDWYSVHVQRFVRDDTNSTIQVNPIDRGPTSARFSRQDDTVTVGCLGLVKIDGQSHQLSMQELGRVDAFSYDTSETKIAVLASRFGGIEASSTVRILGATGPSVSYGTVYESDVSFTPDQRGLLVGRMIARSDTTISNWQPWDWHQYHHAIVPNSPYFLAANSRTV